jgi:hypothetical protein
MIATDMRLIDLPTDQAKKKKWAEGQKKYGPTFVGDPLEQLDSELIDALNDIDEAERRGISLPGFADNIRDMRDRVRKIFEFIENRQAQQIEEPKQEDPIIDQTPALPISFRVYFNRSGELPWSVDSGAGTQESTVTSFKLNGVYAESHFDPSAGDNENTPTAWITVSNAVMSQIDGVAHFSPL